VYALDPETGCAHWSFRAAAEVRTGIVVEPWQDQGATPRIYFGDVLGNVYAVDALTGHLQWRQRADEHPNATITGTPSWHAGRLYVPVSSLEVALAIDPTYPCCSFRGSVVAYDAADGSELWRTHTIQEPATPRSENRAGTPMYGPSGAVVWNSPAIDADRNQLYVATGENMSSPATATSDAIFALDLKSGTVNWVFQATANDVWNTACDTDTNHSCPPEDGPDFDFGAAVMLVPTPAGRDLVLGGQKSGVVHALDPESGRVVWQQRVGRGGIQGGIHFGMAASPERLYVPISDMPDGRTYDHPGRPGLHALDLQTGEPLWYSAAPDVCNDRPFCHRGVSQAVTAIGDLVVAGGMDGVLRIHDGATGAVLWEMDTTGAHETSGGATTTGGSFGGAAGPVAFRGSLYVSSGYGIYNHMPGNLLLRLSPRR
jgi:polyvinyl alcohol dehydrogenase (cytochrome)